MIYVYLLLSLSPNCLPQDTLLIYPLHHYQTLTLRDALGKAVWAETSLETKYVHPVALPSICRTVLIHDTTPESGDAGFSGSV